MDIMKFINDNEGALVGAVGGVLIAIIASSLTHYFSVYRQRIKDKNAYIGLLQTLRIELYYQRQQFSLLNESLCNLKKACIENRDFIIGSIPIRLYLTINEAILSKVIDYKNYKRNIVVLLTMYLNQLRDINIYLDFNEARKVLNYVNENRTVEEAISIYFDALQQEYLDKALVGNNTLHSVIERELKLFKEEIIVLQEYKSQTE